MKEMTPAEALNRAAAYCSKAEHCTGEVREKLRHWEIAPADAEAIITRLKSEKFIDDARYCRSFVRDKYRFNRWGRLKIVYALRAKRVDESLVYDALDEVIDAATYHDNLVTMLRDKKRTTSAASPYDLKAKLYRFAASRGYESDAISRALKAL
jgi:regulatory protein